jgi:hypothetical protein
MLPWLLLEDLWASKEWSMVLGRYTAWRWTLEEMHQLGRLFESKGKGSILCKRLCYFPLLWMQLLEDFHQTLWATIWHGHSVVLGFVVEKPNLINE